MSRVLVVDDEESICWGLNRLLGESGHRVTIASSAEEGLAAAERERFDLIVLDVRLPGMDGLAAMPRFALAARKAPIVVITAFGNLDTAVGALGGGAFDYLAKPFDLEQFAGVVERALAHGRAARPAAAPAATDSPGDELFGGSLAMQEVFKRIALVAPTDAAVLITGESGSGKELVARAIHRHSARASRPFVPVNLASLSPTLVESELFGHVRGAFTGAEASRQGLLELADGATVFFDEAADIPPSVQVKLLRVLEQHEVTPVGDTRPRRTRFRVIAATNRDLRREFQSGAFRQDLYFRLAVFDIGLPPLCRREDDIGPLAQRFLQRLAASGQPVGPLTDRALAELKRRRWLGNVRELRNAVEHGALLARGGAIEPEHLPAPLDLDTAAPTGPAGPAPPTNPEAALRQAVRDWAAAELNRAASRSAASRSAAGQVAAGPGAAGLGGAQPDLYQRFLSAAEPPLFDAVLDATSQNRAAAAERLGIHRATLRKKLQ